MRKLRIFNLPDWMRARFTDGQRFLILCTVAGVLCGLAAVAFHLAIHHVFEWLWESAEHAKASHWWWFPVILGLAPAIGGLAVGIILSRWAPNAVGSGIPQTKSAFYNEFGVIKLSDGVWRFVLGVFYVGLGNALGREGPTVHMCAAISSKLGQVFGLAKVRIQALVPVGMGAGIAAAFNAPLSAITFVFEELLDDFSSKALGGIVIAVVVAAAVSRVILGEDPVLTVHIHQDFNTNWWMLVALPIGLLSGIIGHGFVKSLLWTRGQMRQSKMPIWLRPAAGGLAMGLIGVTAYYMTGLFGDEQKGVFSIGYGSLTEAFENNLVVTVMLILFVFKFLAVIICYSSGGSGGLFSPTLFLGGMLGGIVGTGLVSLSQSTGLFTLPEANQVVGACVLLGMGALFASIVRCPFTSLLIIFEMTRNYALILPLMAGNMISYYLASRLLRVPLYNSLLLQDGMNLRKMPAYQGAQDYRNLPVSTIMTYDAVTANGDKNAKDNLDDLTPAQKHHGYPVVDGEGRLVGVICHHEMEEFVVAGDESTLTDALAKRHIISVTPDTSIRAAAAKLIKEDVLQVPVVSEKDEQKLIGVLTLHDIARQQNTASEMMGR
ncbi:chloride channel protein [Cerasicoccus arenae]|uniref:Cl-channel voltage-gated family protein n=1 Tax=Cerasicoccus arenae TaxID=424488 RepID=A0A8J3DGV8_9BACT|nr:chloride channel protein [Cerasicoccus arenae]MBK1857593.1 chloride channel protein [Cerasicoccus arenae]GHC05703.1 Cl- channel voltage-gated family protein [Cerasicoccus arenae]